MENLFENITLTDEEGNDVEFEVVTKLEIEGAEYFIVAPIEENGEDALALKVVVDDEGEEYFATVDDDDEFNMVNEAFEALYEEGLIE